jgi:hypothetical protein
MNQENLSSFTTLHQTGRRRELAGTAAGKALKTVWLQERHWGGAKALNIPLDNSRYNMYYGFL